MRCYAFCALDALPPSPPAIVAAAPGDIGPRDDEERRLCERASSTDYFYLGGAGLLVVGTITIDSQLLKLREQPGLRLLGPPLVGTSWGFLVSSTYVALPKCSDTWVSSAPREGNVRSPYALAAALIALSGFTAPFVVGIETGSVPNEWTVPERAARVGLAGAFGMVGAALPFIVPPKTWRAARELDKLRATAGPTGVFLGWSTRF